MPKYCLDADTLIESNKGPYSLEIHKTFWKWLDLQSAAGIIFSSSLVHAELVKGHDNLAEWAKARKGSGFFLDPSKEAQAIVTQIAEHVMDAYEEPEARHFLSGADAWVIARRKSRELSSSPMKKKFPLTPPK